METGRTKTRSPVLRARSLAKCYDRGVPSLGRLLRELADPKTRSPTGPGVLWAVRDVTFDLERGHSLGVIGRNGAGKSTLLRLLAGTARPTSGTVESDARIACLLDLGIGFHPMETGRQNAETSLRLLAGMSRREAREALRKVEDFAEIGPFFERPLRTYSAGMHLRLAFAVASLLSPELLITDEVIVVGDAAFQRKCERWFDAFISGGGSLVLCSHDLSQVTRLCENALWIDAGRMRELGASREVARHYRESLAEEGTAGVQHASGEATSLPCELVDLHLTDPSGDDVRTVKYGDTIVVTADVRAPAAVPEVHVGLTRADLTPIYGVSSDMDRAVPERIGPDLYRFRLTFPDLPLTPGPHRLRAHAMDETGTRLYDTVEIRFAVEGDEEEGLIRLSGVWR